MLLLALIVGKVPLLSAAPWTPIGPDGGDARRLEPDPHDRDHLFLGAANGWIYESHDHGRSWVRLSEIGGRDDLVLDSIVVDPHRPEHLAVGAWVLDRPDGGIFLSDDGGKHWTNQAQMRGQSVRSLAISPSDPSILVAGTLQGVFRSTDGGSHWQRISPVDSTEIHQIQSVAIDPEDPRTIYVGTWHLPWKTTDAGEHWDSIKQGIIDDSDVFSIIVDPVTPKTVYASACSGIYKSVDAGNLFAKVQGIPATARRTRVLLQDPHRLETVFAGTTEGLYRTEDAGKNWSRLTGPEIIVNDVSIDLGDSRRVLIATNRGGVLASDDGGDTFHPSNQGFSARQVTAVLRDGSQRSTVYIGVVNDKEWGGVFESSDGGVNWFQRGDGLQGLDVFALGQAPDGAVLAGTAHGLYRMDASTKVWRRAELVSVAEVKPAPPAALPPLTRAPVPVLRNQFAKRKAGAHAGHVPAAAHTRSKSKAQARKHAPAARASAKQVKAKSASARTGQAARGTRAPEATVPAAPPQAPAFDGSVYAIATTGQTMIAATSAGLYSSADNGMSWAARGPQGGTGWRLLSAVKQNLVAASLHEVMFSADSGRSWAPIRLPKELTQITAVVVQPSGEVWVGGREGLFITANAGNTWSTPTDLYANAVNSLYYDDQSDQVTVASAGSRGAVFTIQLPQRTIAYFESGWRLRLAEPFGDHMIAATFFDGMVMQPRVSGAGRSVAGSAR